VFGCSGAGELTKFPTGIERKDLLLQRGLREREDGKEQSEQRDKTEAIKAHVELRWMASELWPKGQSQGATFKCTANCGIHRRRQKQKSRRGEAANGILREAERVFEGARKGSPIESGQSEEWRELCDRMKEEAACGLRSWCLALW